jgi:hypothetical protein
MDGVRRRARFRSFLLGGLVGSAAALAAGARRRRPPPRRSTPAGLAAFEQAPCYKEIVDAEEGR